MPMMFLNQRCPAVGTYRAGLTHVWPKINGFRGELFPEINLFPFQYLQADEHLGTT
jgi:hypothetical protein